MPAILIADDHPLYRDALRSSLASHISDLAISEAEDMHSTLLALKADPELDLLLLDLHMPGSEDLFGLLHIRKLRPEVPIAVVSGLEDMTIVNKVIDAGAMGFIPKITSAEQIVAALNSMLDGDIWLPDHMNSELQDNKADPEFNALVSNVSSLTPAQYKVLCLLRDGMLNKQIGYHLGISEKTVKAHVTCIFKKLHINNRTQAVLIANQLKLTPPE